MPEYPVWKEMRRRCQVTIHKQFPDYGGRGITVCERWQSFANFIADMGRRPSSKHSIDRIDNDGPYSPENCRWATLSEQQRNKRSNLPLITFNGKTQTLVDWSVELGIKYGTLHDRISRRRPLIAS